MREAIAVPTRLLGVLKPAQLAVYLILLDAARDGVIEKVTYRVLAARIGITASRFAQVMGELRELGVVQTEPGEDMRATAGRSPNVIHCQVYVAGGVVVDHREGP